MQVARLFCFCALAITSAALPSCGTDTGDPPVNLGIPPPAGKDHRIYEIADPQSPLKAPSGSQVAVSGAVVIAVDAFDETHNGKSAGSIYVQDLGSLKPYSGISLYSPTFIPGNLAVSAGDALDLHGQFQENQNIPIKFALGAFLPQIANPTATFRFDAQVPDPVEVPITDLQNYDTGRRWLNMLVTVKNVTLQRDAFGVTGSGRVSSDLLPVTTTGTVPCDSPFPKNPQLVNELMDLEPLQLAKNTTLKSLTGVVTYFCNLHIAPRTAADIVQ